MKQDNETDKGDGHHYMKDYVKSAQCSNMDCEVSKQTVWLLILARSYQDLRCSLYAFYNINRRDDYELWVYAQVRVSDTIHFFTILFLIYSTFTIL